MAEAVRRRTDLFAKTVAGLGTAALSAVGIAKFADIFPLPSFCDIGWLWLALFAALGGFVAMGVALVVFSRQLWNVNEAVFLPLEPSPGDGSGLDADELRRVRAAYRSEAKLHGYSTLIAYARRGSRLEADADRAASEEQARSLRAQARAIRANVDEAQARALVNVVRMRASRAVKDWRPVVLFLAGLIAFGLGTDALDSEHTASMKAAKDCAAAVRAVREVTPSSSSLLPAICGEDPVNHKGAAEESAPRAEESPSVTVQVLPVPPCTAGCGGAGKDAKGCRVGGDRCATVAQRVCAWILELLAHALGPPAPAARPSS